MMNKKRGFTIAEVLIAVIFVGLLALMSGAMLVFAYNMFYRVLNQKDTVTQYKTFRLRVERIFRNMTRTGAVIGDIIDTDLGVPPGADPALQWNAIKFDVEYYHKPFAYRIFRRKFNESFGAAAGAVVSTAYKAPSGIVDQGLWNNNAGRNISLYSCVLDDKQDSNYFRYMLRIEKSSETTANFHVVSLYEWPTVPAPDGSFMPIANYDEQRAHYGPKTAFLVPDTTFNREVLLKKVSDFQTTARLSNLYVRRIVKPIYENISVVRLYVKLEGDSNAQYSNDLVFANKSLYGNMDTMFVDFDMNNIV